MRKNRNNLQIIPIYSPRSTYKKIKANDEKMMSDMTLNFDKLTINLLKEQFLQHDNELNLEQFIIIAKKHLKFWEMDIPNRQLALVRYLTFLFNEIDINGNGDMQWEQFTNYIIQKATVLKNLKSKAEQVKQYVRSNVKPKMKIDGIIQKTQYIDDMQRIAFFQQGSNKIYFMNVQTGQISNKVLQINPKKLIINISSVKKAKDGKVCLRKKDLVIPTDIRVLDMIYLAEKKYKILLISTSDGYVRGWKYNQNGFILANQPDNQQQPFEHFFNSEIYTLAWDHINQVLYCGQKNGSIYMWNLKTDLQKALCQAKHIGQKDGPQQSANMMITSMITMPKLQFMASGRMDGKLILWDTMNNKKKRTYKEHSTGILTLAFNEAMILLFSAGFDHKICIWNPYISTLIHKIEGHLAPILSLKIIEGTHQLISMDSQGIVKITDTRRFNFVHSFSVDLSQQGQNCSLSSLNVLYNPLKLVFGGKSLIIYEYDKNYNPHTADEYTAICCKYAKDKLSFFTPMGNKIKVWSALNGDIERIYMQITQNEISTFQFDFLKKRMVVGDTKGNITLHNIANGARMKQLAKHSAQVTHLVTTQNDLGSDIFISCGLDNQIHICKETQQSFQIIRTIYIRKDTMITCLKYCDKTKLIIVGTNVGTLAFYEIQTGKTAGTCYNKIHQQFTSVSLTQQPLIITTTSFGKISIISIPPLPNRFEKLLSFYHFDCEKVGVHLGIRASCYSQQLKCLYIIDDKMYLTCYDLTDINLSIQTSQHQKIQAQRRNNLTKTFQNFMIRQKWQMKAHSQVIKSIQYINQQKLLITTSFDKKVKIWYAETGDYLDSLQQNYNKTQSLPLAYYDTKHNLLYSSNRKHIFEDIQISAMTLQYDPFLFLQLYQKYPELAESPNSNKDWKINVDFKDVSLQQTQKFEKIAESIREQQHLNKQNSKTVDIKQIRKKLIQKRTILRQIHESKSEQGFIDMKMSQTVQQQNFYKKQKKLSNNYFKRSILKCIQKFVDKNQNSQLIQTLTAKDNKMSYLSKNRDFVPIYQLIKNSQRTSKNSTAHRLYIQDLYRKETESIMSGRIQKKIYLSKNEAQAAKKLCTVLLKTDPKDKRPRQLYRNINIKENKRFPLI